jgi:hypothetical protein
MNQNICIGYTGAQALAISQTAEGKHPSDIGRA